MNIRPFGNTLSFFAMSRASSQITKGGHCALTLYVLEPYVFQEAVADLRR
jgi:hypothetical protein